MAFEILQESQEKPLFRQEDEVVEFFLQPLSAEVMSV